MQNSYHSGFGYQSNPTPSFPSQGGPSNLYGSQQSQGQQMNTPAQGSGFRGNYGASQPQVSSSPWNQSQGMGSSQQHQLGGSSHGQQTSSQWATPQQQGQTNYQSNLQYSTQQPQQSNQLASSSSQMQLQPVNPQQQLAQTQPTQNSLQGPLASSSNYQPQQGDDTSEEFKTLFGPLERMSQVVGNAMARDPNIIPNLDTLTQAAAWSPQYDLRPPNSAAPFTLAKQYELPAALLNLTSDTKNHSVSQGLFTEISRAWFVIDGQLFLWDWATNVLNQCDQGSSDMIVSVGLVPPKKTILADFIQHVLVICTRSKVTLIGLSLSPIKKDNISTTELQLHDLAGFSLLNPSGTTMTSVVGASNGRIFCTGSDRCIHEIVYENTAAWMPWKQSSPSCWWKNWTSQANVFSGLNFSSSLSNILSITIDSERRTLYAVTMESSIDIYTMVGEKELVKGHSWALSTIIRSQQSAAMWLTQKGLGIAALSVVGREISSKFALLVTLTNGTRMYLSFPDTINTRDPFLQSHAIPPPDESAVRIQPDRNQFPCSQSQDWKVPSGSFIGTSELSKHFTGVYISWIRGSQKSPSALFLSCPSITRGLQFEASKGSNPLTSIEETYLYINLEGRQISAIGELPSPLVTPRGDLLMPQGTVVMHELLTEVLVPQPRSFAVLSAESLDVYQKARPMDQLASVIWEDRPVVGPGGAFEFQGWNPYLPQLWSIAIAIAQRRLSDGLLHNGSPQRRHNQPELDRISSFMQNMTRQYEDEADAEKSKKDMGAIYWAEFQKANANSRLDGLITHISRLLRPIWTKHVVAAVMANGQTTHNTTISVSQLTQTCEELRGLREFIDNYPFAFGFSDGPNATDTDTQEIRSRKESMRHVRVLVQQSIEAISFVEILTEYNLPLTLFQAGPLLSQKLAATQYHALITSKGGRELAKELVNALMKQQAGPQIGKITSSLQTRCGSFCQPDDVVLYKAMECIRQAKVARDGATRQEKLRESLQHFLSSVAKITIPQLEEIVKDYRQLQFPTGVVRLPLRVAEFLDPESLGLTYWIALKDNAPMGRTDAGSSACDRRNVIYKLVTDSLDFFEAKVEEQRKAGGNHTGIDAEKVLQSALQLSYDATDELFHMSLYEWMDGKGMYDQLLELKADDVRAFLERTKANPDLVWKYYARRGLHFQAAMTLKSLAESTKFELLLSLADRVQYLSSALANAQSSLQAENPDDRAPVAFITELEEQSEVANVQSEIMQAVATLRIDDDEKAARTASLEGSLKTMSELFEEYAQPYDLWICQLLIFHISDYRDSAMTMGIWERLIDEECGSTSASAVDGLAVLVETLGQKFHPSPAAFPVDVVMNLILNEGFKSRSESANPRATAGWVVRAFRSATVSSYDIFAGLQFLRGVTPPFTEFAGMLYLDEEMSILLPAWLKEYEAEVRRGEDGYFPATEIDSYINTWLMEYRDDNTRGDTGARIAGIRERFGNVANDIRRRFS